MKNAFGGEAKHGGTQYTDLVFYKTYADLRAEASRTYISFLWWLIEPIMYMAGFYAVFAVLLERRTPNFVMFLLVGLVTWKWFASTVSHASGSILNNSGLMQQIYLPKVIFPLVTVLTDTVKFLLVFSILLAFLLFHGGEFGVAWFALPLLLLAEMIFLAGAACLAAAVVPVVPDLRIVLDNALLILMFLSGVFYDASTIPEPYRTYFYLNPMASLIESYRMVLLYNEWPSWTAIGAITLAGLVLFAVAAAILKRLDRSYPRLSIQ